MRSRRPSPRRLGLWLLGLALAGSASAQRCGDHLLLAFRDADGKPIPPQSFTSVRLSTENIVDNLPNVYSAAVGTGEAATVGTVLETRTGCGLRWVTFDLTRGAEVMHVTFRHVPGDSGNILLDGVDFAPGHFDLDLGWDTLNSAIVIDHPARAEPEGLEGPHYILRHPRLQRAPATP